MSAAVADEVEPDFLYEVIDGEIREKPMSAIAQFLGSLLVQFLGPHCRAHELGRVTGEGLFPIPGTDRDRRPDCAFVSYVKWPKSRGVPHENLWPVVPDLVAEVVSPTDWAGDLAAKVEEYLRCGVSVVWVIYPEQQMVLAHSQAGIRRFHRTDDLVDEATVPGFQLPLIEYFSDVPESEV